MDRAAFLYKHFILEMGYEPTPGQDGFLRSLSSFLAGDDGDIFVLSGYAGTGKTTAIAAVVGALTALKIPCVLLAPTGRSAKVLSAFAGRPAHTIHKGIYRQKSVDDSGFGRFTLTPNKARDTVFIVDEVSLIGTAAASGEQISFGSGDLLSDLVSYVRSGVDCRLILSGDDAQLPPVGLDESPALAPEVMEQFGGVSYCTITDVVRQASESGILRNATRLRELIRGAFPGRTFDSLKLDLRGVNDVERIGGADLIETLSDAYSRYGSDETVVLCRSNKRAVRYNLGIRSQVEWKEEKLSRGDKVMIVKNCYQFLEDDSGMDYIANGDVAEIRRLDKYTDRYGLHFASATLSFPDYGDMTIKAKVCLDTLESESASLTREQQDALFRGVDADYSHIQNKRKRYEAVREDPFYNALQLKYAAALTCHKSQGGQWKCVFIDNPFWQDEQSLDDLKWLYTAMTRAVEKVYLVNFNDRFFEL